MRNQLARKHNAAAERWNEVGSGGSPGCGLSSTGNRDTLAWLRSRMVANPRWVLLALLIIVPSFTNPYFRSAGNVDGFLGSISVLLFLSMGEAFALLIAGIDLSVGAAVALGSVVLALLLKAGLSLVVSALLVIVVTGAAGVASGVTVAVTGIPSFIVTFAMMGVEYSVALMLSSGNRISLPATSSLPRLVGGQILAIPGSIWLAVCVLGISSVLLRNTRLGRHLFSTGSSISASHLSGVKVKAVIIGAFAVCGAFGGLAAIVYTGRIASGNPIGATYLNLEAIASAVIGGVNLFGGRGSLLGACVGAVIYGLITNVLNLYGVNANLTEVVGGLIIIVAAYSSVATAERLR